jgi:hypothetical protein
MPTYTSHCIYRRNNGESQPWLRNHKRGYAGKCIDSFPGCPVQADLPAKIASSQVHPYFTELLIYPDSRKIGSIWETTCKPVFSAVIISNLINTDHENAFWASNTMIYVNNRKSR